MGYSYFNRGKLTISEINYLIESYNYVKDEEAKKAKKMKNDMERSMRRRR